MIRSLALLSLALAGAAHAQTPAPTSQPRVQVEDFDELDEVEGRRQGASDLETIRRTRPLDTLVRVRTSFRPELLESAESL